jgi:hypothetical protein
MAYSVEGLLYKPEGVIGYFVDIILQAAALGSIKPLTEMNTRDISSG